jgi:hypothetical protein
MTTLLKTETNIRAVENRLLRAARIQFRGIYRPRDLGAFFEHGQWWLEHKPSGAQWSVADCTPGNFCFEQVTQGDED